MELKKYKTLNPDKWVFTFGKHKGKVLRDVLNEEPSYVWWCIRKFEWFVVSDQLFQIAKNLGCYQPNPPKRKEYFANPFEEMGHDADHQWEYIGG